MTTLNTIIEEEKIEETFNYLCTVDVDEGGFMRANGTMDSYAQALWLRKTSTTAMQRAYEAGREEERDRILNILSNLVPKDEDAMDVINDWIIPELKRAIHSELDQPNK